MELYGSYTAVAIRRRVQVGAVGGYHLVVEPNLLPAAPRRARATTASPPSAPPRCRRLLPPPRRRRPATFQAHLAGVDDPHILLVYMLI